MKHVLQYKSEFQGIPVAIETDKGQWRHWYDPDAKEHGTTRMLYPYGYVEGTMGLDGDEVDVFIGPKKESKRVFIITQLKRFDFEDVDEQKVMLGFNNAVEAKTAYLQHYNNARFFGDMKEMSISEFKSKLKNKKGELIKGKSALIKSNDSAKLTGDNMLFLDISKAGDFKTSGIKPGSEVESKVKYTVKSNPSEEDMEDTDKAAIDEEEMDLKKEASEDEEVGKSLGVVHDLAKALRASAIAGISKRARMDAAYQAGMAAGRQQEPLDVEPAQLTHDELNIGVNKSRPLHEPPQVPVRKVETPFAIPPKKCGDHEYRSNETGPQEAKPFWRRR